jgi:hypothetical protein
MNIRLSRERGAGSYGRTLCVYRHILEVNLHDRSKAPTGAVASGYGAGRR